MFDEEVDPTPKSKRGDGRKKPGVMKHVAKPTSNIKLMLMSRGDSSKKKKEVRNRGLCHVSEFTVYCFLQTSASLKDDPVLAGMLKEIGERKPIMSSSRGVGPRGRPMARVPPVVTPHRPSPQLASRQSSTPQSTRQMPTKRIRVVRPEERQVGM